MALQIRRLSYALGAEVSGVDISKSIDAATFDQIHRAFLDNLILLFRDQPLDQQQFIAFSRRFGELDPHEGIAMDRHPDYPEILLNTNKPKPGGRTGFGYSATLWHSDRPGGFEPALASALRSIEVPEVGGDTMFANMYLAYETLSDAMKKLISELHTVYWGGNRLYDTSSPEKLRQSQQANPPIALPICRRHEETGRTALYLGERARQIVGLTEAESRPLIDYLCRHAARPQFVYRHCWRNHDLIIWDNRCINHLAVDDYDKTQTRYLERTTIMGTPTQGYRIRGFEECVFP
jgi:taurine dioxygenase